MRKFQAIWTLGMLAFALSGAWAQDNSTPPQSTEPAPSGQQEPAPQNTPQEPVPAYGQENSPPLVSENPPLSGLDLPSLEPHAAPMSYLQPGVTASQSVETNAGNLLGGGGVTPLRAD